MSNLQISGATEASFEWMHHVMQRSTTPVGKSAAKGDNAGGERTCKGGSKNGNSGKGGKQTEESAQVMVD
eukprot:12896491-Prorocentrum_lima.AAC.1